MKFFSVICFLVFTSVNLHAESTGTAEQEIDRACLKQAITLVNELKSEIYVDMDSTQSNQILKLATATCRQQFSKAETKQSIAAATSSNDEESGKEEESEDWFTEHILSGEVSRKKGNKRLMRK